MKQVEKVWAELSANKVEKVELSAIRDLKDLADRARKVNVLEDVMTELGKADVAISAALKIAVRNEAEAKAINSGAEKVIPMVERGLKELGSSIQDFGLSDDLGTLEEFSYEYDISQDLVADIRRLKNAFPEY